MGRRIDVTVRTLEVQVRSRTSRWGSASLLRLVENVARIIHLDRFQRSLYLSIEGDRLVASCWQGPQA